MKNLSLEILTTLEKLEAQSQAQTSTKWVFMKDLYQEVKKNHKSLSIAKFHETIHSLLNIVDLNRCSSAFAHTKRYGIQTRDGIYALIRKKVKT